MMFSLGRLNGVLALALLFLISSAAAVSPQLYKPRAAVPDAPGLRTNAKRMAAGLSPLKPRVLYQPSRVTARGPGDGPGGPSGPGAPGPAPSPVMVSGRLRVNKRNNDGSAGTFVGYLAKALDTTGDDAGSLTVDSTTTLTSHATISFIYSQSSGNTLNVAISGAATSFPYIGFAFAGTASPKLTTGTYNFFVATGSTNPGASASAVGNSLTKQTGPPNNKVYSNPNSESAIWGYSSATGVLTAIWNNPNNEVLSSTRIFYDSAANVIYQGTSADSAHNPSTYEVVLTVV